MTDVTGSERRYLDELIRSRWITAIDASSAAGNRQLTNIPCLLAGFTSGSGSAYVAHLYDGDSAAGNLAAVIAGSQNAPGNLGPFFPGIPFQSGLYLDNNSGSFTAVVYVQLMPGGF